MSDAKTAEVVVIGSGAGGAPAAYRLAKAWGDGVVVLEQGRARRGADFTQLERDMVPALYAGGGAQSSEDGSIGFLQGVGLGGSTVINDALCFAPPPEMIPRWSVYGVDLAGDPLDAYVAEVEAMLHVSEIPQSHINRANYLLGLGAAKLGWRGERLRHNSPACLQCGFRHLGCAYDAKKAMHLTYLPAAVAAGARVHPEQTVRYVEAAGDGWRVVAGEHEWRCRHVVFAAGVVGTPTLLLRSGIDAGHDVQIHLQPTAFGDFADPVHAFDGIPMSYGILEFADVYGVRGPGFLIEGVGLQPMAFAVQPPAGGDRMPEILARYRFLAGALGLIRSAGRGRISLGQAGRPRIDYPLVEADAARVAQFYARAVEVMMAAGAQRTLITHRDAGWLTAPPPAGSLAITPGRQYLYTAHPFGGAGRGTTTDGVGRVKGHRGLWVLDASAFPEALGVNPQITIAALALQGADRLLADAGK
jgi:choline dehydrogenase-like flavoprotein